MNAKKNVLIIGGTSKIARLFIAKFRDEYAFTITQRSVKQGEDGHAELDLSSSDSVQAFITAQDQMLYDAVLVFASVYEKDPSDIDQYLSRAEHDMRVNTLSQLAILKGLRYQKNSTVLLFGDAGTGTPKPGFSIYTVTKAALSASTKPLAIDLKDTTKVLTLKLGPTLAPSSRPDTASYYAKNLFSVDEPVEGLIDLCHFLIQEKNLGMTGSEISYDGGAYLKR